MALDGSSVQHQLLSACSPCLVFFIETQLIEFGVIRVEMVLYG